MIYLYVDLDSCNYFVDPNGGSILDAVEVCCEPDGATCFEPVESEIVGKTNVC